MTTARRAIGFIRTDIAGRHATSDHLDITLYAAEQGLALVKTIVVPLAVADPTLRLINGARANFAQVVLTPSHAHVGRPNRAITEQWELHIIATRHIYLRGHRWPSTIRVEGP